MSNQDLAGSAALKALKRPRIEMKSIAGVNNTKASRPKSSQSISVASPAKRPEKGGAEAEVHRQAALEAAKVKPDVKKPLSQKGSAEAYVHNMAAKEAIKSKSRSTPKDSAPKGSGAGLLFVTLLLPMAVIAGLYIYSKQAQNNQSFSTRATKTTHDQFPASSGRAANGLTKSLGLTNPLREKKHVPAVNTASQTTTKTVVIPAGVPKSSAATPPKNAHGSSPSHWDYSSTDWASLDTAYKTCGTGQVQSPINIQATTPLPAGPNFHYNYLPSTGKINNNGHTLIVNLAKGNQLLVNGNPYELLQFYFHTPSENQINNRAYPMELHMVHKNQQGQLVVVAVMIKAGPPNPLLDRLPLPAQKGQSTNSHLANRLSARLNPVLLLPYNRNAYTFSGSLTTPPCSQNVGWIVMKTPITVSPGALARFQKLLGKNNRPLQPANRRTIFSSY